MPCRVFVDLLVSVNITFDLLLAGCRRALMLGASLRRSPQATVRRERPSNAALFVLALGDARRSLPH